MNETTDIVKQYVAAGFELLLLALLVMVILAVSGGFAYSYWVTVGFTGMTLAFTVGALIGLALLGLVGILAYFIITIPRNYIEHRQRIEQAEAEALLREHEPQPFVVQDRPIIVNKAVIPAPPETIGGIPAVAWEYFVNQLVRGVPISQGAWDKRQLPGGYEIASFDSYSHLVDPLVELGIIADRDGERRKSGRLTTTDPAAIMAALREWERNHERRS